MKKIINCFFVSMVLFVSVGKADTLEGKVGQLWVNEKVWFRLEVMPPAADLEVTCNTTARYVVDSTTDKGRSIYSVLLFAKASGLEINVVGSGDCNLHSDSEGVAYISVLP